MLTEEQVKHIAKLARLGLSEAEVNKFSHQLSDILAYVEKLEEVDTDKVLPTSQVTGLKNVMRDDVVQRFCTRDELLGSSEQSVESDQIKVKSVMNN